MTRTRAHWEWLRITPLDRTRDEPCLSGLLSHRSTACSSHCIHFPVFPQTVNRVSTAQYVFANHFNIGGESLKGSVVNVTGRKMPPAPYQS